MVRWQIVWIDRRGERPIGDHRLFGSWEMAQAIARTLPPIAPDGEWSIRELEGERLNRWAYRNQEQHISWLQFSSVRPLTMEWGPYSAWIPLYLQRIGDEMFGEVTQELQAPRVPLETMIRAAFRNIFMNAAPGNRMLVVLEMWANFDGAWESLFQSRSAPASFDMPAMAPPAPDNLVILATPATVDDRGQLVTLPTIGGGTLLSGQVPDLRQLKYLEGVMADVPAAPYEVSEVVDTAALVISDVALPQYAMGGVGKAGMEPAFEGFISAFSQELYGPYSFQEFEEMWGFMEEEGPEGPGYESFTDLLVTPPDAFQNYVRNVFYTHPALGASANPILQKIGSDPYGRMLLDEPTGGRSGGSYLEQKMEEKAEQAPTPKLPPGESPLRFLRPPMLGPEE